TACGKGCGKLSGGRLFGIYTENSGAGFDKSYSMSATVETTNVWGKILHSLKGRLNQQTLDTWFSPIRFESLDSSQHVLRLRAPNQDVKDWIVSNYGKVLAESLNEQ